MSAEEKPVQRLVDAPFPEGSAEQIAAEHLRGSAAMPDISAAALARVSVRLAAGAGAGATRDRSRAYSWLRWRTAAVVVLAAISVGGATTAAVWVVAPRVRAPAMQPVAAPDKPVARASGSPRAGQAPIARLSDAADPADPAGPDDPAPASAPAAAPPRPIVRRVAMAEPQASEPQVRDEAPLPQVPAAVEPSAEIPPERPLPAPAALTPPASAPPSFVPAAPAASPATRLALEAELLSRALGRLRRDRDPKGALALLDQHALRFPHGALAPEADITRVDALLALDRRDEAAAILNRLTLPSSARGRELLVVRAELGARARRWAPAIADFTRALADPALEPELTERSLHGRAACHLGNRNRAAARADLDDYLRRFPDGRFVTTARITLRDLESNQSNPR
jgi:hypothetical protein